MFTLENKNKLINELNDQLKSDSFYPSNKKVNSVEKKSSPLYRPFMSCDFNPLIKPVYDYAKATAVPVYGIAFEKKENSCKNKTFSETQELNMCDIIPNTDESSIINFKAIPKEMALAKIDKNTNFWNKDIDIIGTIKSIFKK